MIIFFEKIITIFVYSICKEEKATTLFQAAAALAYHIKRDFVRHVCESFSNAAFMKLKC